MFEAASYELLTQGGTLYYLLQQCFVKTSPKVQLILYLLMSQKPHCAKRYHMEPQVVYNLYNKLVAD